MSPPRPSRLLVVCPSWVGDAVMATPTLRLVRGALPGACIGLLARPGSDEVLAGLTSFDELHVERAAGLMGPKRVAARLRPARYDTALLLTNSFSTALTTRIAGIPRRVGYDRDGRGFLLTDRIGALRRASGGWAPVPAVWYYLNLARFLLGRTHTPGGTIAEPWHEHVPALEETATMELAVTEDEGRLAGEVLVRAGVGAGEGFVVLNPGGNNPAKRWPAERFAQLGDHVARAHGVRLLINAAPGERDVAEAVRNASACDPVVLTDLGMTLGALKGVLARARLLVTNDTGPRHIAAALRTPVVTLFGPTDHRWTTIVAPAGEAIVTADPTMAPIEIANDHPGRCAIGRIGLERVVEAADGLLTETA